MLKLPTTGKTCLIEEIKIVPNGEPKPVKAMELSHESVRSMKTAMPYEWSSVSNNQPFIKAIL